MPFNSKICGILALDFIKATDAHMKMASPVPFNVANLDNSPLQATGSNFPCKADPNNPSSYSVSAMNEIPVDKPILLSLAGSAPHDGGTCQVSITFDEEPTKDSVFKVIQTFEGSCPKENNAQLTFNIPKDFPNAERATLAWTWFNKIGNREMYMDCAPISITGGSDNKDYYESLPDMFVANIATTDCSVEEGKDVEIPDPGDFVLRGPTAVLQKPDDSKCPTGVRNNATNSDKTANFAALSAPANDNNKIVPVAGGGGSSGPQPSAPAVGGGGNDGMYTPPATTPAQPSSTAVTPNNGQYSQAAAEAAPSSASSAAAYAPAPSANAPVASYTTLQTMTIPTSSVAESSAAAPAYPTMSPSSGEGVSGPSSGGSTASPTGSSSSSNGAAGSSTICTTEGAIVCNGPDQFGLCNHGKVLWQDVAGGTTCSNGSIQRRSAHVRRHAHGAYRLRAS